MVIIMSIIITNYNIGLSGDTDGRVPITSTKNSRPQDNSKLWDLRASQLRHHPRMVNDIVLCFWKKWEIIEKVTKGFGWALFLIIEKSPLKAQKKNSQFKFNEKNSEKEKLGEGGSNSQPQDNSKLWDLRASQLRHHPRMFNGIVLCFWKKWEIIEKVTKGFRWALFLVSRNAH